MSISSRYSWIIVAAVLMPNLAAQNRARKLPGTLVAQTVDLLPEAPAGIGWPCSNRAAWAKVSPT